MVRRANQIERQGEHKKCTECTEGLGPGNVCSKHDWVRLRVSVTCGSTDVVKRFQLEMIHANFPLQERSMCVVRMETGSTA